LRHRRRCRRRILGVAFGPAAASANQGAEDLNTSPTSDALLARHMSFRSRRALGIRAPLCSALLVRIRLRSYIGYSTITTPLLLVSGDPGDPQYRTSSTKCDETHPPGRGSALNTIRLHPQDVIFTAGRPEKSTSNAVRILVGLPLLAATSMTNKGQPQCSANDCVSRRARLFLGRRGSRSARKLRRTGRVVQRGGRQPIQPSAPKTTWAELLQSQVAGARCQRGFSTPPVLCKTVVLRRGLIQPEDSVARSWTPLALGAVPVLRVCKVPTGIHARASFLAMAISPRK
jgi:hypothetical protein